MSLGRTNNPIDLAAVEHFAAGVQENSRGVWFNPYAMAQTMLGLADWIRVKEVEALTRLREYDAITLGISRILDDESLSKKQIRERLHHLYLGDRA